MEGQGWSMEKKGARQGQRTSTWSNSASRSLTLSTVPGSGSLNRDAPAASSSYKFYFQSSANAVYTVMVINVIHRSWFLCHVAMTGIATSSSVPVCRALRVMVIHVIQIPVSCFTQPWQAEQPVLPVPVCRALRVMVITLSNFRYPVSLDRNSCTRINIEILVRYLRLSMKINSATWRIWSIVRLNGSTTTNSTQGAPKEDLHQSSLPFRRVL